MKRSQINKSISNALEMLRRYQVQLPAFAHYSKSEFIAEKEALSEVMDVMLGWDVTDFGEGDFSNKGLTLFTLRNGIQGDTRYPKPYAEKLLFVQQAQHTPLHFHWYKMEDIINRNGGNLMVRLYNALPDDALDMVTDVCISIDGKKTLVKAGDTVCLTPGQSITLTQRIYHEFWAQEGTGDILLGEVSMCNDDENDNRFYQTLARFSIIEEDEASLRLLCNEYAQVGL